MMPIEDSSVKTSKDSSELHFLDMKEIVPFESNIEEQKSLLSIFGAISNPNEFKEVLNLKSSDNDSNIEQCPKLSDWDESIKDKIDIDIKLDQQFSNNKLHNLPSAQYICPKKSLSELESCSIKELNLIWKDLSHVIKKVSSELVQLLLENDALQQESDARNVAIEQLLKMTVKNSDVELRQIQMSIILPEEEDSDGS